MQIRNAIQLPDLGLLEEVAKVTPDGDRFASPQSTFAQDTAICFDAALRATDPTEECCASWIEFAIEPAIIAACDEQTGFTDLGTSERGREWRARALQDAKLRRAYGSASDLIAKVSKRSTFIDKDIDELRKAASGLRGSAE